MYALKSQKPESLNKPHGNMVFYFDAQAKDAYQQFERMHKQASSHFQATLSAQSGLKANFETFQDFQDLFNYVAVEFHSPGNGNLFITYRSEETLANMNVEMSKVPVLEAVAA